MYDVAIIGGGINGLSAAAWLVERGCRRVALLERFALGHDRGSSHGRARITRSVYAAADYVALMQRVHAEGWPWLEARAGRRLVHPSPGCFFGPEGGLFDSYRRAVEEAGADVVRLSPAEAARRFPQFRFSGDDGVLEDRTSGVVAAAEAIEALIGICREGGVALREGARVRAVEPGGEPLTVQTDAGEIHAGRVIVCAGPWAAELLPSLRTRLTVTRQSVGYFHLAEPEAGALGRFPVWVELGMDESQVWYGLPSYGQPGIKAAHHDVVQATDPELDLQPDPADIEALTAHMRARLALAITGVAATERCLYTVGPGEDFVIDLHPEDPRIVVGAGFAGHGFKFGPTTGRVLAELALDGVSGVLEFEDARDRFRF